MAKLKRSIALTRGLAIVCLPAGLMSHLALTDIAHAEPDLRLEWLILQISAGLFLAFLLAALSTLGRCAKALDGTPKKVAL